MKALLVQFSIAWEDKDTNFDRVRQLLADAPDPGGYDLIVLPELFATGYSMNSGDIAETVSGPTETFLAELARTQGAAVIGGLALRGDGHGKPCNAAVAFSAEGGCLGRYAKTHPLSLAGEDQHYARGEEVLTFPIEDCIVSPSVCYDLRFPEVYRLAALAGTHLYVVIANWPEKRIRHWTALLRARAIENQAYVIGVNRCGEDPQMAYGGRSAVFDYLGECGAEAGTGPAAIEVELDFDGLLRWREEFPALRDRHDRLVVR